MGYTASFIDGATYTHTQLFIPLQKTKLDFSEYKQPSVETEVNLPNRTFHTKDLFGRYENCDEGPLIPMGLAFFQSDYDSTLHHFYHNVLNMEEPKYEYHFLPRYSRPWNDMYKDHFANKQGFNNFLDRYRDPKEIQEEILKKRLKTLDPIEGDLDRRIKYPNAHFPHPDSKEAKASFHERAALPPTWRLREIERERLRRGLYKDLDWFEPRRDPCN